jgi:hypothetical protein
MRGVEPQSFSMQPVTILVVVPTLWSGEDIPGFYETDRKFYICVYKIPLIVPVTSLFNLNFSKIHFNIIFLPASKSPLHAF